MAWHSWARGTGLGPTAYTHTILLDCVAHSWAKLSAVPGDRWPDSGLLREPRVFCFLFSFFFFLLARGLLNFQFLAVPIPGRHISVLIPTRAKIDSVTKNKSQLPDEANVIHAETNPETNERWNTRRLVCIHGTGFGLCVHSVVRNIYTE